METSSKLREDAFDAKMKEADEKLANMQHQLDILGKDNRRIDQDLQNTDFFLNKVQPIANLTTFFTVLRSVTDDEDQLDRINELQKEFFDSIGNPDQQKKDKLAETLNSKRGGSENKKVSPHYKGITAMMDEFANNP